MLAMIAWATLLSATNDSSGDDSFVPNYATRMLSPVEDRDYAPRLFPARRSLPIRVGVVADPSFVTDDRLVLVREACGAWVAATQAVQTNPATGGRALAFRFVPFRRPGDADVVFAFGRTPEGGDLTGLTLERRGWASVSIAVEASDGTPLARAAVLRTATHEMGHALGIWGHSPDDGDIMAARPRTDRVSRADANTLRLAYAAPKP